MNGMHFLNSSCLYIEIGQGSMKVLQGEAGVELPLERLENGRLTGPCKDKLILSLRNFLKRKDWQPRMRAVCAIGARGVSLRRLTLPPAAKEELQRLLLLQIESESPLPPEELAWGYRQAGEENRARAVAAGNQEVIVAAVKREVIEEYAEVLAAGGVSAVFTLGALARSGLCPQPPGSGMMLDIGRRHSELACFDNGIPTSLRILSWGGEDITQAIEKGLGISRDEAEKLKIKLDQDPASHGESGQRVQAAMVPALDSLAGCINGQRTGQKLYLTGRSARHKEFARWLAMSLGDGVKCEVIEMMPGEGRSAAILGLKKSTEKEGGRPPLIFQVKEAKNGAGTARPVSWKWAALAVSLLVGLL